MFENIPQKLQRYVRKLGEKLGVPADDRKYAYAALYVALEYIRLNLQDKEVANVLKIPADGGALDFRHFFRLALLGESLFVLRSSEAFPELCRRLRERAK